MAGREERNSVFCGGKRETLKVKEGQKNGGGVEKRREEMGEWDFFL